MGFGGLREKIIKQTHLKVETHTNGLGAYFSQGIVFLVRFGNKVVLNNCFQ